jgi:hypothetical protein
MKEQLGKIEFPQFVKFKSIMKSSEDKSSWLKIDARINPAFISAYHPVTYDNNGETNTAICIIVSGHSFYADMTLSECDKMMEDIERGYKMTMDE